MSQNMFPQLKSRKQRRIRGSSANPAILLEAQVQPLFSKKTKSTAAEQSLQMFLNLSSTNTDDTNLSGNNVPNPSEFEIYGVSLFLDPDITIADYKKFMGNSSLTVGVSGKTYLEVPVHQIPSGGGTNGIAATTVNNEQLLSIQNGPLGGIYKMDWDQQPIHIQSLESFFATVQTFAGSSFSAEFTVQLMLHGVYWKPLV